MVLLYPPQDQSQVIPSLSGGACRGDPAQSPCVLKTPGSEVMDGFYSLSDGSQRYPPAFLFKLPDGSTLKGVGTRPDQVVTAEWMEFAEQTGPQILAAQAWLAK